MGTKLEGSKAMDMKATATPRGRQQQSAWAMKPTERRQPPSRATVKPTNNQHSASPTAKPAVSKPKSPGSRPAAGAVPGRRGGMKNGDCGGEQGSRPDRARGRARERSSPSPAPSKRLTPRVSVSRTMAWEKSLRSSPSVPPSSIKWDNSPGKKTGKMKKKKKRAARRALRNADNGGGPRTAIGEEINAEQEDSKDGRPSVGTWEETKMYLEVLMEYTGKDHEELEWLVVARNGGGVARSEKKQDAAETDYHRLLFEESTLTRGLKLLSDRRLEAALKDMSELGDELEVTSELLEELALQSNDMTEAEATLKQLLEDVHVGQKNLNELAFILEEEHKITSGRGKRALDAVAGIVAAVSSARELVAPTRAKSGLRGIKDAAKTLTEELKRTRIESQSALDEMEKWRVRKEELPEFEREKSKRDQAWLAREGPANEQALQLMRSLIPVGVSGLTVAQLKQRAIQQGSLYPHELAQRFKENRLLHWIVMHPDDIARTNFLKGCHAHFFTNFDQYDLVEMRAVLACLPAKFEADGDGKKAAWKTLFFQRVKSLVAQERGEMVSGGWDPSTSARRTVRLPKLTAEQTRRKEYSYPSPAEVDEMTRKLQERQRRLAEKKAKLAQVKDLLLPEAKTEYRYVLEDTRHPANRKAYTPEDLRRAKRESKEEVDRLSKEATRLEAQVSSAQRVLRESPHTLDTLREEAEATRRLLSKRARNPQLQTEQERQSASAATAAGTTGQSGLREGREVQGAFDPTPELKSRFADKSSSLRFVTPDEDKQKRREELAAVFAGRGESTAAENATGSRAGHGCGSGPKGSGAAETRGAASDVTDGGRLKGSTKALGSILEKKLGPGFFTRATAPGGTAGAAGIGAGGKMRAAASFQRQQDLKQEGCKKTAATPTPRFEPKSKLFRSILGSSPVAAADAAGGSVPLPPPPPPLPPMACGLLEEIRKRGGGGGGGMVPPPPPPPPMGLPLAPGLPFPRRSLFPTSAEPRTTGPSAVQGPPAGMFAELKAKAAAREASRRAAEA